MFHKSEAPILEMISIMAAHTTLLRGIDALYYIRSRRLLTAKDYFIDLQFIFARLLLCLHCAEYVLHQASASNLAASTKAYLPTFALTHSAVFVPVAFFFDTAGEALFEAQLKWRINTCSSEYNPDKQPMV